MARSDFEDEDDDEYEEERSFVGGLAILFYTTHIV